MGRLTGKGEKGTDKLYHRSEQDRDGFTMAGGAWDIVG